MLNNCPACKRNIFEKKAFCHNGAFVSSAVLAEKPFSPPNLTTISLAYCNSCGVVFNQSFQKDKTHKAYESKSYVVKKILKGQMSDNLNFIVKNISRFLNKDSSVMEIGSGDGKVASEISRHCHRIITVDPSYSSITSNKSLQNIEHYNDYFSRDIAQKAGKVDFVIARHILEHITEPLEFINLICESLKDNGSLYIEIPNMEEIVKAGRYYDIFNDHFAYYSKNALLKMVAKKGLHENKCISMHNNQHVGLFLTKRNSCTTVAPRPDNYDFSHLNNRMNEINNFIRNIIGSIAIYGAGAHGVTMFNYMTKTAQNKITTLLDKDKNKQGLFIPGTDTQICCPDSINVNDYNNIVLAVSLYESEVSDMLHNMGFEGRIVKTAKKLEVDLVCV